MHIGWNATSLFIPQINSNFLLVAVLILSLAMLVGLFNKVKGGQRVFSSEVIR